MKKLLSLMALVVAIGASAFTAANQDQTYYFKGNATQLFMASEYETTPSITCSPGSNLPCIVIVPGEYSDIEAFLDAAEQDPSILEEATFSKRQ